MSTDSPNREPGGLDIQIVIKGVFNDLAGDLTWQGMIDDGMRAVFFAVVAIQLLPTMSDRDTAISNAAVNYGQVLFGILSALFVASMASRAIQIRRARKAA